MFLYYIFLLFATEAFSQNIIENKNILPYTIFPLSYDLQLTPNFENGSNFTFDADLKMDFKPKKHYTYSSVVLHMDNITVKSVQMSSADVDSSSPKPEDVLSTEYDPDSQWYNVTVSEPFTVDKVYRLTIKYSGVITNDKRGFYRSSYVNNEGKLRWFAVTQLRPIYARRLLPCLDEPRYKANFKLSVWIPPQYVAVSNMPVKTTSPTDQTTGRALVTFQETPKMSSFLLALAVFDFAPLTSDDRTYSTWTLPHKITDGELSQQMIPRIVHAMEELTASTFPLPKMDQIALPDLEPVAMENWGMNTYREENILYRAGRSPPRQITNVPRFTGHEVAHYWIGNSVTISWWDWLWISEAFAMYLEYYLPHQVDPSWRMLDQVIVDLIQPGLLGDSFPTSVPLTTHVETRAEIVAKFSGLTYTKGPALIRMVEHYLSSDKFRTAFKNLLRNKAFSTVTPSELWSFFDVQAATLGLPASVTDIMATWTDSPGYPVITVTRDYRTSNVRLMQERFLQERSSTALNQTLWWIPLSYTTKSTRNFTNTGVNFWLCNKCIFKDIQLNVSENDWIIFNLQQTGFYRVNYDPTNWNLLINQLKSDKTAIHVLNRAQLIDDSFQLARARRLSYTVVLQLLTYLKNENDYIPWSSAFKGLDFLERRLTGYPALSKFKKFIKDIIAPLYREVGYEEQNSENHMIKLIRLPVITWACSNGIDDCRRIAGQKFKSFMANNTLRVSPGLEAITLCTAIERGGKLEWDFIQNNTMDTNALACSSDQSVIVSYLSSSIATDVEAVWSQKFTSVISCPVNINTAFQTLLDNIDSLRTRFGTENLKKYISQLADILTTTEQREKLRRFLISHSSEGLRDTLTAVLQALNVRLAWKTDVYPTIEEWLTNYTK